MIAHKFPLSNGSKRPWPKVQWRLESSADTDQLIEWALTLNNSGWGLDCGKSEVLVIDIDCKPGQTGLEDWANLLAAHDQPEPETREVRTPSGGRHLYFAGARRVRAKLAEGIDLKSTGGYVCVPPTPGYEPVRDMEPQPLPAWLESLVAPEPAPTPGPAIPSECLDQPHHLAAASEFLRTAPPAIEGAGGDLQTYQVCLGLRDRGLSESAALELMLSDYNDRCEPPWDPGALAGKIRNAYRYGQNPPGSATPEAGLEVARQEFGGGRRDLRGLAILGSQLRDSIDADTSRLLGRRWLCRGGSCLVVGQTGIGKSSFAVQAAMTWALGRPLFGIAPARPLKSLILQAENDDGDLGEMVDGVLTGLDLWPHVDTLNRNVILRTETASTGPAFLRALRPLLLDIKPDLVWIDPLYSYLGGNVSDQETVSRFLRNGLGPLAEETGACWMICHHTKKPAADADTGDSYSAYSGAGSAELANWARATLALQKVKDSRLQLYKLDAGKRGIRAGLTDLDGQAVQRVSLAHGSTGICWLQTNAGEALAQERLDTLSEFISQYPKGHALSITQLADALDADERGPLVLKNLKSGPRQRQELERLLELGGSWVFEVDGEGVGRRTRVTVA